MGRIYHLDNLTAKRLASNRVNYIWGQRNQMGYRCKINSDPRFMSYTCILFQLKSIKTCCITIWKGNIYSFNYLGNVYEELTAPLLACMIPNQIVQRSWQWCSNLCKLFLSQMNALQSSQAPRFILTKRWIFGFFLLGLYPLIEKIQSSQAPRFILTKRYNPKLQGV